MKRILSLGAVCALLFGALALPAAAQDFDSVPHLVKDIRPGDNPSSIKAATRPGATLGSLMIFGADDGSGDKLWVSDGTNAGTKVLSATAASPQDLVAFAGRVYFSAVSVAGRELWQTDGTAVGTTLVAGGDIDPGAGGSNPIDLTVAGSLLYFIASPSGSGQELYSLGAPPAIGPPAAPHNVSAFGGSFGVENLAAFGNKVVFSSTADAGGFEPWISDGVNGATHTFRLKDVHPGATSSDPDQFTTLGSTVFFAADESTDGVELWKSDGTSLGTSLVKDVNPGATPSIPTDLFAFDGQLLFGATVSGVESLWASDGTADGTQEFYGITGGGTDNNPIGWTLYKGWVYFSGSDASGAELWRTKGGPLNTTRVKNINTGTSNSSPQSFKVVDGLLYFNAKDATHGSELWRTDGTSGGTKLVKDINPGTNNSYPVTLGAVSNTLFLEAQGNATNKELWAYTTHASTTKAYPKSSYSKATANAKHIKVTVKVRASGFTPTGLVVLKKGSVTIGTGTLSHGNASIRITVKLHTGKTTVRAYYGGTVRARSSHSSLFTVKVS